LSACLSTQEELSVEEKQNGWTPVGFCAASISRHRGRGRPFKYPFKPVLGSDLLDTDGRTKLGEVFWGENAVGEMIVLVVVKGSGNYRYSTEEESFWCWQKNADHVNNIKTTSKYFEAPNGREGGRVYKFYEKKAHVIVDQLPEKLSEAPRLMESRLVVVGHSMGGTLAVECVRQIAYRLANSEEGKDEPWRTKTDGWRQWWEDKKPYVITVGAPSGYKALSEEMAGGTVVPRGHIFEFIDDHDRVLKWLKRGRKVFRNTEVRAGTTVHIMEENEGMSFRRHNQYHLALLRHAKNEARAPNKWFYIVKPREKYLKTKGSKGKPQEKSVQEHHYVMVK